MARDRAEAVAVLTAFHESLERAEREGPAAFDRAFHHPPAGVGVHEIDLDHVVRRVSREELKILGYTLEQMVGHPVWDFIVMHEAAQRSIDQKLKGKKDLRPFARTFRCADGRALQMLLMDRLLVDRAGTVIGLRTALTETILVE
jgi:PAS domain S-box-containing protein